MRAEGAGHQVPPASITGPGTLQVLGTEGDMSSPLRELTVLWKSKQEATTDQVAVEYSGNILSKMVPDFLVAAGRCQAMHWVKWSQWRSGYMSGTRT